MFNIFREVEIFKNKDKKKADFPRLIGQSKAVQQVKRLIKKVERSNVQVLIAGETGTGKEVVARTIHYQSSRSNGPFVAINMGAIPEDLIESELFGHEKSAFTGADSRRIGKFEEAIGGTIFLDEIGEMDLSLQTKLLRVLQEKTICRVGSNDEIKLDIRILAATNKALEQEVEAGNFREDLYYRLQGFLIFLPPLRERGKDVLLLSRYFLAEFCKANQKESKTFSKAAEKAIMQHNWPGNIRELKSFVERTALMSESVEVGLEDLIFSPSVTGANNFAGLNAEGLVDDLTDRFRKNYREVSSSLFRKLKVFKS